MTPTAVVLSTCIGDFGCGHPISMSVWRRGTISLAVMNSAASSASAADEQTNLMILASVRMDPLSLGIASFSVQKMYEPPRLRDLDTLRYEASEWLANIMSLALYVMPSLGYVAT